MADRQTQIVNFYESTISGSILASAATSFDVSSAPTTNGTTVINASIGTPDTWFYLVIDPDECIDCNACVSECPVDAIFPDYDLPDEESEWLEKNEDEAVDAPLATGDSPVLAAD